MPELPEVETIRRWVGPLLEGRRVLEAASHPSHKFTPGTEIVGRTLGPVTRRAKYLIIGAEQDELVVHLGMTGQVLHDAGGDPPDLDQPHLRAWWRLDDGWLRFVDTRRFGRLRVVPAGDYSTIAGLANAGPEPWDPELDGPRFAELLAKSGRPIKTRLLSQRPIAGVGNIYADEALWAAGIHPRAARIGRDRAERLLVAIRQALQAGLDDGGTTLADYRTPDGGSGQHQHQLAVYGRAGQDCLRCGRPLRSTCIDARTSTYCARCQKV